MLVGLVVHLIGIFDPKIIIGNLCTEDELSPEDCQTVFRTNLILSIINVVLFILCCVSYFVLPLITNIG